MRAFIPAVHGPWQHDWECATEIARPFAADLRRRLQLLERLLLELRGVLSVEPCWPAIAALADELEAHESLEVAEIEEILRFWIR